MSLYGLANVERHRDHLIYGATFLFWAILAYVEVAAYSSHLFTLALTLLLMTSLFTILIICSQFEKFKPEMLFKVEALITDKRYMALAVCELAKLAILLKTLNDTRSLAR